MTKGMDRAPCRLKFEEWPAQDQTAWREMVQTGDPLDESGPAAHWRPATEEKRRKSYGRWLDFLDRSNCLDAPAMPADRITRANVGAYLENLKGLAPFTIAGYAVDLVVVMRLMAPDRDWGWLHHLVKRLYVRADHERTSKRVLSSTLIYDAALELIEDAVPPVVLEPLRYAVQIRDGLTIALLAARPIRLKNLAMIEIGRHLVEVDNDYHLVFTANETKTHRHLEFAVPEDLIAPMRRYLEHDRIFLLGERQSRRLWINQYGVAMNETALYRRIVKVTEQLFGERINPHRFRDAAATSIAIEDPGHVRMAAAILGHSSLATTEAYYNQAKAIEAGRLHQQNIVALRKRFDQNRKTGRPS